AAADLIEQYRGGISRKRPKPGSIDLADAMNVITAAHKQTNVIITADQDYRWIAPTSGHTSFRLLPWDL
ncbi:MAG: hypothetical protein LBD70_09015, partial [Bifidobacteriaceae bacterium]|nr:hypothetical protein [Bifidobacteriaceae bacterium]